MDSFSIEKFSKSFGALKAVNNVSFTVEEGEIVGFCGPNGAGKTTLFDLISGLTKPDIGLARVNGKSLPSGRPDLRIKEGIARSFQLNASFGSLSVAENLKLSFYFAF